MSLVALPVDDHVAAIVDGLACTPNLVVMAEPGAGKTTRVPPALAAAPWAQGGAVWVLEPRRLAARLSAERVAQEQAVTLGEEVGYAVRFTRKYSSATRILFLTEALLVQRLLRDPKLCGVTAVVLDEFHERSLYTDLSLALLHRLQQTARPDLRLVVMSATLNPGPLAEYLGAGVVNVPGRTFPVDVHHLPARDDRPLDKQVEVALRRVALRGLPGDVLVFLPGAAEIRRATQATLALCRERGFEACVLHGDLPAREQDRALGPTSGRKVIFSTNIAETSVTLPGVGVVIDSGLARVSGHSPWSGLSTLQTQPVSRASAVQRAGRAGRVRAGVCQRLYTEADFASRPAYAVPELCRADLTEARLWVAALAGAVGVPWFEPPPAAAWSAAEQLLGRLGALDPGLALTSLGERLLALPVHPRLGRLALAAADAGYPQAGAALAALLGERDLRLSARSFEQAADDRVGDSDLLEQLDAYEALEGDHSDSGARRHGLDPRVVRAAAGTERRLLRALPRRDPKARAPRDEALLKAILCGYPDRVAQRRRPQAREVVFAGGGSGVLAPTSVVKEAPWLVAVQAMEQRGNVSVRAASAVQADWLFEEFFDQLEEVDALVFEPGRERVEQLRQLCLGKLVLEESRRLAPPGPASTRVLVDALWAAKKDVPWDPAAIESLRLRAQFAARHDARVQPFDDEGLRALIAQHAEGSVSFAELRAYPLEQRVPHLIGTAFALLSELSPLEVTLPGGRRLTVHYEPDRPPWVQARLQDFFGMSEGPRVAKGRERVVLHLLAPNRRPVQVTTDLASFWRRHYPDLRRELMRRYPRHAWPEDPLSESPPPPGRSRGRR